VFGGACGRRRKTGLALDGENLEQETTWRLECRWEDNIKMDLN
jgi:hypothetical protein